MTDATFTSLLPRRRRRGAMRRLAGIPAGIALAAATAAAQEADPGPLSALRRLSVEELMAVEVTAVSKQPEKWFEAASAVQVVTGDEIRRSGATNLPEALRLAPNLQVTQADASQWAISARGFNNLLANKLLVMIDGRTVYTPLYAGVFWDVQNPMLEDIEQIEIVSGPGGALWGANAVNGVINVITKSARDTQGLLIEGGAGSELRGFGGVRYGGQAGPDAYYRIYTRSFDRDGTVRADGTPVDDGWHLTQGGVRVDWMPGEADQVTLQSDLYDGRVNPGATTANRVDGQNVLGRWKRTLSATSDFQLQVYYDRTFRDFGSGITETLETYDFDGQNHFALGDRQQIVWGVGLRVMQDRVQNSALLGFWPADKTLPLYSAFAEDEITLLPDSLRTSLGLKFEHNDYTGGEFQPSARLTWTPTGRQTVWAAISSAVRTPSRVDRDLVVRSSPSLVLLQGGADFESEDLVAYELGWRVRPQETLTLSLSSFYHQYDQLRSAEPGPPPTGFPVTIGNGVQGHTYGVELAGSMDLTDSWRLRAGYTLLREELTVAPDSHDLNQATAESNDPEHQFMLQSMLDLPHGLALDAVVRYVAALPHPRVPAYTRLDLRLAWCPRDQLELSLVGQNLLDSQHREFVPSSPDAREIERGVYGKVTWRY